MANPEDREILLANPDAIDLPVSQIEAGLVFVAELDGAVVGFAALLPAKEKAIELDGLFVEPLRWRRGIGRALVDYSVAWAAVGQAPYVQLISNPRAEGFYHRCGFETLGPHLTQFGPAILMERRL